MPNTALRFAAAVAVLAAACSHATTAGSGGAGWRPLFDGKSFAGWRGLGYDRVPAAHWRIVDGTIEKVASRDVPKGPDGRAVPGGDLMTEATFGDFELAWEWKATPGANSGLKYNVSETMSTGVPETATRPLTGAPGAS